MEDGTYRITTWSADLQTVSYNRSGAKLQGALTGTVGEIFNYSGSSDDGASYIFAYESGWLDLGSEQNLYLKFVKRMTSFVLIEANVTVNHTVEYDFGASSFSFAKTATSGGVIEWNQFEWSSGLTDNTGGVYDVDDASAVAGVDIAKWGGGANIRTMDVAPKSGGQYIKIGMSTDTNNGTFSLQQINLYAKVGRLAT